MKRSKTSTKLICSLVLMCILFTIALSTNAEHYAEKFANNNIKFVEVE